MPAPERQARDKIDQWLTDAGWRVVPYARWQAGDRTHADARRKIWITSLC